MNQTIKEYFTRPHRQVYYPFDLGPSILVVKGNKFIRQDFHVTNRNSQKLAVSFFHSLQQKSQNCVVYLHTHNGSKLQALPLTQNILALGVSLCLFDFAGYGNSEGVSVTLGCREMWDIQCVLNHLSSKLNQKKFILWGRSMGAVAALLYLATRAQLSYQKRMLGIPQQNWVVGGIYDSPFHSLEKLTLEVGSKSSSLPQFLMTPLIYLVKKSLREDINFEDLELSERMKHIKVPGIFITSHQDTFVHYSHSELLYKDYGGRKELVYIERDHNQIRREEDLSDCYDFIGKLHEENPKHWQNILANNLQFQRKHGESVYSLYSPPHV